MNQDVGTLFLNTKQKLQSKLVLISNFISTLTLSLLEAFQLVFIQRKIYINNFLESLRKIIWTCLPIATLTVGTSSIIYSIHVAPEFAERGLSVYLGGLVALALIREGAPVMGALAIVTQFCSGMTAQIGSMKITDQLDAMKMSKVSPNAFILIPMLFAGIVGFPIVIIICIVIGLTINFFSSNFLINITYSLYSNSILNAVHVKDILLALTKASIFGFFVTLVSYNCGMLTVGGSKAVGNSTRLSVVINFALVIILDYIITALWL
ncbi:MAG: ABC transporter permease [Candidatus Melainabacteria bacterium]|nr:ABC transporter permease [Candidatus Melainabacteria bacterium]